MCALRRLVHYIHSQWLASYDNEGVFILRFSLSKWLR